MRTSSRINFIYSLDTSNPVVHGIKGIEYKDIGLWSKESQKLFEMINSEITLDQFTYINTNIEKFRKFTNG